MKIFITMLAITALAVSLWLMNGIFTYQYSQFPFASIAITFFVLTLTAVSFLSFGRKIKQKRIEQFYRFFSVDRDLNTTSTDRFSTQSEIEGHEKPGTTALCDFFLPKDQRRVASAVRYVIDTAISRTIYAHMDPKFGPNEKIRLQINPAYQLNSISGATLFATLEHDAREQLLQQSDSNIFWELMAQHQSQSTILLDFQGEVFWFNQLAQHTFPHLAKGTPLLSGIPNQTEERISKYLSKVAETQMPASFNSRLYSRSESKYLSHEIWPLNFKKNEDPLFLLTSRDITHFKIEIENRERQIESLNTVLEEIPYGIFEVDYSRLHTFLRTYPFDGDDLSFRKFLQKDPLFVDQCFEMTEILGINNHAQKFFGSSDIALYDNNFWKIPADENFEARLDILIAIKDGRLPKKIKTIFNRLDNKEKIYINMNCIVPNSSRDTFSLVLFLLSEMTPNEIELCKSRAEDQPLINFCLEDREFIETNESQTQTTAHVASAKKSPTSPIGILLVDDENDLLDLFSYYLSSLGHKVLTATDGVQALKMVQDNQHEIDVIITDQTMPIMTGCKFIEELRRAGFQIPIILATGFHSNEIRERAKRLGITSILNKPYTQVDVINAIEDAVKLKQVDLNSHQSLNAEYTSSPEH